jgi:hypothetical protein
VAGGKTIVQTLDIYELKNVHHLEEIIDLLVDDLGHLPVERHGRGIEDPGILRGLDR